MWKTPTDAWEIRSTRECAGDFDRDVVKLDITVVNAQGEGLVVNTRECGRKEVEKKENAASRPWIKTKKKTNTRERVDRKERKRGRSRGNKVENEHTRDGVKKIKNKK